jgi:hypothetical protein
MHERFGISETIAGGDVILAQLVELARGTVLDGVSATFDEEIRQALAQFACELAAKKYNGLRALTKRLKGQQPGAESPIGKLVSTELSQRMTKFAARLLGPYATLERHSHFAPEGDWMRRQLWVEALTNRGRLLRRPEEHDRRTDSAAAERLSAKIIRLSLLLMRIVRGSLGLSFVPPFV